MAGVIVIVPGVIVIVPLLFEAQLENRSEKFAEGPYQLLRQWASNL